MFYMHVLNTKDLMLGKVVTFHLVAIIQETSCQNR